MNTVNVGYMEQVTCLRCKGTAFFLLKALSTGDLVRADNVMFEDGIMARKGDVPHCSNCGNTGFVLKLERDKRFYFSGCGGIPEWYRW